MTQDEIIELGKQAGIKGFEYYELASKEEKEAITTFAKLIAAKATAKEREACAKVVQIHLEASDDLRTKGTLVSVLDYIKARGEQA